MSKAKELQRAHVLQQLAAGGVTIVELPGGCLRLHGQFGNVMLTTDVLNLRPHEIDRLCNVGTKA